TVNDGNGKSASASVNVRTKKTDIQISKSGYVDNGGQNYYTGIANQKAHYTITVSNNGTIDATDVKISDTIPDAITNPEIVETVDGVSISGNTLSGTVNIPAGDSVTINIEGTISADASGNIENTASANDKTSDKVTFTPKAPEPNLSINKSSSIANFIKSETPDVIYTITVKNDGNATAENVTVSDDIPADITVSEIKVGDTDVTSSLAKDNKFSTVISSILAGETVTVTIKGTISGTAKNNIENTAKYTYGNKTVSSNKVTIYAGDDPNKFKVTKRAINADDTDKEYVSYYDNEIEYEVTFTNNSNDTLTELYMYDIYRGYYDTSKNDIVINVVSGSEYGFEKSYTVTSAARPYDDKKGYQFNYKFKNVKIPPKGTVIFKYIVPLKKITTQEQTRDNIYYKNEVSFDAQKLDNLGKFKAVSEIHYNDVKVTKINGNLDKYGNNLEGYINISKSAVNGSLTDSYPFTIIFSGASFSSSYLTKKYIKEITFKDKI
ncbi:MAG TPA: hypothetical protein DCS38_05935, partial [Ruminococcus sp.]|nr:hypothetical protein [Ruminococcus sp.]